MLDRDAIIKILAAADVHTSADDDRIYRGAIADRILLALQTPDQRIAAIEALHRPLYEDGLAVGCTSCDWEQPGNDVWPCPTIRILRGGPATERRPQTTCGTTHASKRKLGTMLDRDKLVNIIEQAFFEDGVALTTAYLAADRILAARTEDPRIAAIEALCDGEDYDYPTTAEGSRYLWLQLRTVLRGGLPPKGTTAMSDDKVTLMSSDAPSPDQQLAPLTPAEAEREAFWRGRNTANVRCDWPGCPGHVDIGELEVPT